ncbi:MAG: DUF4249 domain-containing protein [Chitinophagaceae bacterium]|nr:DUF4249 domain-containing protein [Chitinophagaceae bacterium]
MKRKINIFYLLLFFVSFILSCTKDKRVEIDLPFEPDKIVLNSLITSDSIIYAKVTNSTQLYNINGFSIPPGAAIGLYENDVFKEMMTEVTFNSVKYFVSSIKAKEGKTYTLKASANNMDDAEGSDIVPSKPFVHGVKLTKVGDNAYKAQIKLHDKIDETNFYRLRIFKAGMNNMNQLEINRADYFSFTLVNFDLNPPSISGDEQELANFFTDEKFSGKQLTLDINFDYYSDELNYVAIELVNLTPDAYKYLKSVNQQGSKEGDPLSEAVIVYNNIRNGYGIVGGMADTMVVIKKAINDF